MSKRIRYFVALLSLLVALPSSGQERAGEVDIFAGVDFAYRDISFDRLFDVLVNITPGVKWYMGKGWQASAQAIIPVYNDYGDHYKRVRLSMAVLSKEWDFTSSRQFLKVSGGLFSRERYGLDVKWMYPATEWLAFDAQVGITGYCSMAEDWAMSDMKRITGVAGARLYLTPWNTEFTLRGGRYVYADYGVKAEAMRHFKHVTVGVYGQYNDANGKDAGFKFVVMLPPYKRSHHKVNFRPASNFRHVYSVEALDKDVRMYNTDPEENEREGWFDRTKLHWGSNTMQPDYVEKGGDL